MKHLNANVHAPLTVVQSPCPFCWLSLSTAPTILPPKAPGTHWPAIQTPHPHPSSCRSAVCNPPVDYSLHGQLSAVSPTSAASDRAGSLHYARSLCRTCLASESTCFD